MENSEEAQIDHEVEALLADGVHDLKSIARELVEANRKLREVPVLREQIHLMQREIEDLRAENALLARQGDDSLADGDQHESESDGESRTESGSEWEDSGTDSSEFESSGDGTEEDLEELEDTIIPIHWFREIPVYSFLPTDILHIVFDFVVPAPEMLDHSNQVGFGDPWWRVQRMKTDLAHVCKTWHSVALRFLYHDVILRHIGQIPKFARTVSADPTTFGHCVRRLTFACPLPDGLTDDVQAHVSTILNSCPSLERLSFESSFESPFEERQETDVFGEEIVLRGDSDAIANISYTAVTRRYPDKLFALRQLHVPSATLKTIRFLEIPTWSFKANEHVARIELPAVETLALATARLARYAHRVRPHYPEMWLLPSLKHVRFRAGIGELSTGDVSAFFTAYGKQLLSLGFGVNGTNIKENGRSVPVEYVLEMCPSLTHLAFEPNVFVYMPLPPTSHNKAATHVDLVTAPRLDRLERIELIEECKRLHNLIGSGWKSIRFFEHSTVENLPDLPYCPSLPRTRADYDLEDPLDIYGYEIDVIPEVYMSQLVFYEPY